MLRHGHSSGAKQAAEKGLFWVKSGKKHTAGAEARIDSAVLTARLQSCRQFSRKMLGFSPCVSLISIVCNSAAAKAGILFGFSRHDSSRALTLQTFPTSNFASSSYRPNEFFRSLLSPGRTLSGIPGLKIETPLRLSSGEPGIPAREKRFAVAGGLVILSQ